ncbi:hypothetical protein N9N28_01080 [Rubripirellula amarantea]|nr:hypothetical protein [Rubripirellula amarantea]
MNEIAAPTTRMRFVVAMMFVVVIGLTTIALLVPMPRGGRMLPAIGDMVHAPLFSALTLFAFACVHQIYPAKSFRIWVIRSLIIAALFVVVGVGSEYMQGYFGRSKSLHDAVADSMGISASLGLLVIWGLRKWRLISRTSASLFLGVSMLPFAVAWWGPTATLADAYAMPREFPMLSSFERPAELERWHFAKCRGKRVRSNVTSGNYALEVAYQVHEHPTATMYEMVRDWSQMDSLRIDATLAPSFQGEFAELAVQIIDARHGSVFRDVHRQIFQLQPGKTLPIEIKCDQMQGPTGRKIDLSSVVYLDLQLVRPDSPTIVRFDSIRLVPQATD